MAEKRHTYDWAPCDCMEAYKGYPGRHQPEGCTATWTDEVIALIQDQGFRIVKLSANGGNLYGTFDIVDEIGKRDEI